MIDFVEVLFRSERIGYFLNNKDIELEPDMQVIVKVERGEDIGIINNTAFTNSEMQEKHNKGQINNILRIATDEDVKQLEAVKKKEDDVKIKFSKMLERQPFVMKLLDAVYQLDGNKLTFFFSADGRIDFREFVRELATEFKTRIELHQSSGREDAKRLGGYGMCGRPYCCVSFLKKFNQVTIQMAKDQNLISNLSKISGPCGRLLCCLHYEEDFYAENQNQYPRIASEVIYKDKKMYVVKNDLYNNCVHLSSIEDNNNEILPIEDFKKLKRKKK